MALMSGGEPATTAAVPSRGGDIQKQGHEHHYERHGTRAPTDGTTKGDHTTRAHRVPISADEPQKEHQERKKGRGAGGGN